MRMHRFFFAIRALALAGCSSSGPGKAPEVMAVAHRGCWLKDGKEFYINENCPAGVRMIWQSPCPTYRLVIVRA